MPNNDRPPSRNGPDDPAPAAPRSGTADLLKGTAVVLMIQVHLMELFAQPAVLNSWAGRFSLFLGGVPAAPVFLLVMGYYLAASRRSNGRLLWRGLKLIGLGGLLNLGLNANLLVKIGQGTIALDPRPYILGVDILFLAGASTMMLAVLRPVLRRPAVLAAVAAGLVALVSPWVTTALTTTAGARWVLAYVGGAYEWSYFPWFPWLAYPLLGFASYGVRSHILLAVGDAGATRRWRIAGLVVLIASAAVVTGAGSFAVAVSHELPRYYHHDLRFFGWTCAFLVVWVGLHRAAETWWGNTSPLRWLKGLGRNVTVCYVVQWLIIGNLATALYKTESLLHWGLWVVAVVTATSLVSASVRSFNRDPTGSAGEPTDHRHTTPRSPMGRG